jgi:probable rRNA maturation factor
VSGRLFLRNHAQSAALDLRFLRRVIQTLVRDLLHRNVLELGIYVMSGEEMTRLNETFLQHRGVTDVITFDYAEPFPKGPIQGEIFVCLDEARVQACRFRTTWQNELARYVVHGLLHLDGYDDRRKADRLKMKRRENQLLRQLARKFPLEQLGNAAPWRGRVSPP